MAEDSIRIRFGTREDGPMLAELGALMFRQAFGPQNTEANMQKYLEKAFSAERQAEEAVRPGSRFLILEREGKTIGYARLQKDEPAPECVIANNPIEIVRFYIVQEYIGKGMSGILMQECLREARSGGHDIAWLGVWEENPRAIAFYKKWGFEKVGSQHFLLGDDDQRDWVMACRLSKD